jgi:hypothetical protein
VLLGKLPRKHLLIGSCVCNSSPMKISEINSAADYDGDNHTDHIDARKDPSEMGTSPTRRNEIENIALTR